MLPDLKLHNVSNLEFSARLPLSSDIVTKIRDSSRPDKDGDSLFFDSYKGRRTIAIVEGAKEDTEEYRIEFVYTAASGGRLGKRLPRIRQLVDVLSLVKEPLNFECTVSFKFGKSLRPRSIISLPMKYIEAPNMPFDRIQGFHLVKLDGNEIRYDVYLEAPTQGVLFENIVFKYTSTFNESLPDAILAEAKKISDRIVFKESKRA